MRKKWYFRPQPGEPLRPEGPMRPEEPLRNGSSAPNPNPNF